MLPTDISRASRLQPNSFTPERLGALGLEESRRMENLNYPETQEA